MDFGLGLPSSAFGKDELRRVSEFEVADDIERKVGVVGPW